MRQLADLKAVAVGLIVTTVAALLSPAWTLPDAQAAAGVPVCSQDQLALAIHTEGATGNLASGVTIRNRGAACRLNTTVGLTITTPEGRSLDIRHNGRSISVQQDLLSGGQVGVLFVWSNWCGLRRDVLIRARTQQYGGVVESQDVLARCDAPDAPSTLNVVATGPEGGQVPDRLPATGAGGATGRGLVPAAVAAVTLLLVGWRRLRSARR